MFRKQTPNQHAMLLRHLSHFEMIFDDPDDVQNNFDRFYSILLDLLDRFYPERSITSRDPPYVTLNLQALLRRKNRLMRSGKIEEANAIAVRIGATVRRRNSAELRKRNLRSDSNEVWKSQATDQRF